VFVGTRRRRAVIGFVALFQILSIVASFQISTVGHFVRDFVQVLSDGRHHHEDPDQDEDDPGHECPPGCPNCRHVHLSGASVPVAPIAALSDAPPIVASAQRRSTAEDAPPGPQLPSIYRPPRT
jgi:hypothetical protein